MAEDDIMDKSMLSSTLSKLHEEIASILSTARKHASGKCYQVLGVCLQYVLYNDIFKEIHEELRLKCQKEYCECAYMPFDSRNICENKQKKSGLENELIQA